jgi:peptidyl-dipeptidase A
MPAVAATKVAAKSGPGRPSPKRSASSPTPKEAGTAGPGRRRAEWVAENFITLDTETITAQANEQYLGVSGEIALKARRYKDLKLPEADARKLMLLQQTLMLSDAEGPRRLRAPGRRA